MSGHSYLAQLSFKVILEDAYAAAAEPRHSLPRCELECMERQCGCADPLLRGEARSLAPPPALAPPPRPPCDATRLACLLARARVRGPDKITCKCKPPTQKIMTYLTMDSSMLTASQSSFYSVYAAAASDPDSLAVLNILVRLTDSKIFHSMASETWITLMSSLGGVFSMFLGISVMSGLELVFWGLFNLPNSMKDSCEMNIAT